LDADAGGEMVQQVPLQPVRLVGRDLLAGEGAVAGGDVVDAPATIDEPVEQRRRGTDAPAPRA
jgi:hypothetical protein